MFNTTSIESYRGSVESGLISRRHYEVLGFIIEFQGAKGVSQGDAARFFNDASSSYQPRFRELEDCGIIRCVGTKKDSVTEKTVKTYVPTGKIPTERIRKSHRVDWKKAFYRLLQSVSESEGKTPKATLEKSGICLSR